MDGNLTQDICECAQSIVVYKIPIVSGFHCPFTVFIMLLSCRITGMGVRGNVPHFSSFLAEV